MSQGELALRILLAALAGLLLGLERELGGHPAGVRTHLLVAAGACLFTVAGSDGFARGHVVGTDPTRVAAQVASGIGFLGAGTIMRLGASIRGLTTAATVWISGALGVAAGVGAYLPLVVCLGTVLLALAGLPAAFPVLRRIAPASMELHLAYEHGRGTLGPLVRGLTALGGRIDDLSLDDDALPGLRRARLRVRVKDRTGVQDLIATLQERPEVRDAAIRL